MISLLKEIPAKSSRIEREWMQEEEEEVSMDPWSKFL